MLIDKTSIPWGMENDGSAKLKPYFDLIAWCRHLADDMILCNLHNVDTDEFIQVAGPTFNEAQEEAIKKSGWHGTRKSIVNKWKFVYKWLRFTTEGDKFIVRYITETYINPRKEGVYSVKTMSPHEVGRLVLTREGSWYEPWNGEPFQVNPWAIYKTHSDYFEDWAGWIPERDDKVLDSIIGPNSCASLREVLYRHSLMTKKCTLKEGAECALKNYDPKNGFIVGLIKANGEACDRYFSQADVFFDEKRVYYVKHNWVQGKAYSARSIRDVKTLLPNPFEVTYVYRAEGIEEESFEGTCLEKFKPHEKLVDCKYTRVFMYEAQALEQAGKAYPEIFKVLTGVYKNYSVTLKTLRQPLRVLLKMNKGEINFLENYLARKSMWRGCDIVNTYLTLINKKNVMRVYKSNKSALVLAAMIYNNGGIGRDITFCDIIEAFPTITKLAVKTKQMLSDPKCSSGSSFRTDLDQIIGEYTDYLRVRRRLIRMRGNISNLPVNLKPSRIRDYHLRVQLEIDKVQNKKKIALYSPSIEKQKAEGKDLEFFDKEYSIILPKDAEDIVDEGSILSHCVGRAGYIEEMSRRRTRILFLRKNSEMDKRLITIEEKNGIIRQCFGYHDSYNKNPEIRDTILRYAKKRELQIAATIYKEEVAGQPQRDTEPWVDLPFL